MPRSNGPVYCNRFGNFICISRITRLSPLDIKEVMEPLSALAFACNVLDLVEKGIKCSQALYALYKEGATDDQNDLATLVSTIDAVVTGLQQAPASAGIRKSALDSQLAKLLVRSTEICSKLRDLTKKCQPEGKGSIKAAGVALFKKIVHKSEIETLERDLQTCRAGIASLLSTATQYVLVSIAPVSIESLTGPKPKYHRDAGCAEENGPPTGWYLGKATGVG